uniref:Uncharacterized protein n=1 Tax=Taeniopygia guttata TaxID=59729 RepID=A0A674HU81_TAEGU
MTTRLEEKRRAIEAQKKRIEAIFAKHRQRLGQNALQRLRGARGGEIWGDSGQIWGNLGKFGEIWVRFGVIWGNSGQIWVRCRPAARCASPTGRRSSSTRSWRR